MQLVCLMWRTCYLTLLPIGLSSFLKQDPDLTTYATYPEDLPAAEADAAGPSRGRGRRARGRVDDVAAVEVTWLVYQDIIDAYRHPNADVGKKLLTSVIDRIKTAVPAGLEELAQLGRTLEKRRDDILAWFDHPGSSNGPTEAINGRLEHLRGIALGFRNLVNYIAYAEFRISDGMSTSGLC